MLGQIRTTDTAGGYVAFGGFFSGSTLIILGATANP